MPTIGIDLEQFTRDPYATGIQRVLQQLAINWPSDVDAHFVIPYEDETFRLVDPLQAAQLLSLPFDTARDPSAADANTNVRARVSRWLEELRQDRSVPSVRLGQLLSIYDGWLLPEVSYLPSVLERLALMGRVMPVTMVGYDALPMTDPQNYRFVPGTGNRVSEYFRHLAQADAVVCISEYSRGVILERLRRDVGRTTTVSHPGGDHLSVAPEKGARISDSVRFIRVGAMEERKQPLQIIEGFRDALSRGMNGTLLFIGNANASSEAVNRHVRAAMEDGLPIEWIQGATDEVVHQQVAAADVFLSVGTEGYGIPVLEAIRLGTPVAFSGVQPAAEVMEGRGATRMHHHDAASLGEALMGLGETSELIRARQALRPDSVPRWSEFAENVARQAVR